MAIIVLDRIVALAGSLRRTLTGPASRVTRIAVLASLAVLVATAVPVVLVLRTPERLAPMALDPPPDPLVPTPPEPGTPGAEARPAGSSRPAPGHPTGTGAPTSAASPSASTASPSTAAPVPLRAAFAVEESALLGYGAAVTITNPGPARVPAWTLVVTLPRESLRVTEVTGARATQDGATWTFVPDGSGPVPGGGSVRVTFRVAGAPISSTPTACTIDGVACTGLPG
ncbi:cellulose binding domain-containing protein [Micromonospora globbae]|uniref:cellulose binding domain-containing protein n=1 Tax=Micromonospora globbae TaxID=1894969 RepID=UPI00386EC9FC|nr:cellulose-binding domain-containing protein [Micromonospora globbae]